MFIRALYLLKQQTTAISLFRAALLIPHITKSGSSWDKTVNLYSNLFTNTHLIVFIITTIFNVHYISEVLLSCGTTCNPERQLYISQTVHRHITAGPSHSRSSSPSLSHYLYAAVVVWAGVCMCVCLGVDMEVGRGLQQGNLKAVIREQRRERKRPTSLQLRISCEPRLRKMAPGVA